MIYVDVEKYCHDCPEFEPRIDKDDLTIMGFELPNMVCKVDTKISCEHRHRCEEIKKFIEKESKYGKP